MPQTRPYTSIYIRVKTALDQHKRIVPKVDLEVYQHSIRTKTRYLPDFTEAVVRIDVENTKMAEFRRELDFSKGKGRAEEIVPTAQDGLKYKGLAEIMRPEAHTDPFDLRA